MEISRRQFVRAAVAVSVGFRGLHTLLAAGPIALGGGENIAEGFGPLLPDANGILDLPKGFSYTIISRAGETMDDGLLVPGLPDGMASFTGPDGKLILVRNHELSPTHAAIGAFGKSGELRAKLPAEAFYDGGYRKTPALGGTTTLHYDPKSRKVVKQFMSLAGTECNCAGGPTPWGSWVTCEETTSKQDGLHERDHGYAFEVPANLSAIITSPQPLKAMGRFRHEAIAVDPKSGIVYQTEDLADGAIYRFIPATPGKLLAGGRLQILAIRDARPMDTRNWPKDAGGSGSTIAVGTKFAIEWLDIDNIDAPDDDLRVRGWDRGAARFARGEGMWYGREAVYFACTNGGPARAGQIWRYVPSPFEGTAREKEQPGVLELFIEPNERTLLDMCDNLCVAPFGDLIVCEDGEDDSNFIVGVTPAGKLYKLARDAKGGSEFAGSNFSPDGETLFVNMQQLGLTLAISGPWQSVRA